MKPVISRRNLVLGAAATALALPKVSAIAQDDMYQPYIGYVAASFAYELYDTPPWFPGNDCANFLSRVLWKAGLPESELWTNSSEDESLMAEPDDRIGPTRTAAVAADFVDYLVNARYADFYSIEWSDNTAEGAQVGDIIAYCWGRDFGDGRTETIDHVAMVTFVEGNGYPHVTEHSENNLDRDWSWSKAENNWIEYAYPGSSAYLIRMYNGPRV